MKILISAYACEPNKGSEPGVGWQWALEIARLGHDVRVLTRVKNRKNIEKELSGVALRGNMRFLYYDLPLWARWWKRGIWGMHLYYVLWQWGAYRLAKKAHRKESFDLVHHITFGSVSQPVFMGNLGIPFIFGPVGGGDRAPWRLRTKYCWRGWVIDALRDLALFLAKLNPVVRQTFKKAERIYVTSEKTRSILPRKYRHKASLQMAIGYDTNELPPIPENHNLNQAHQDHFRVLYAGRLVHWKGMDLGLPAFACLLKNHPEARLTIVGKGPDEHRLRTLAKTLGIEEHIDWISWLARENMPEIYASHDVCLFPSLHESGGMVALEALAHSLPVVCFAIGGPATMMNETCGLKVNTDRLSKKETIQALANYMGRLAEDPVFRSRLSEGAARRARELSWSAHVGKLYAADKISV